MKRSLVAITLLSMLATPVLAKEFIITDAQAGTDLGNWSVNNSDLGINKTFSVTQRVTRWKTRGCTRY